MTSDKGKAAQRIEAARSLSSLIDAGKGIKGKDHRQAYLHDKIEDAVKGICSTDGSKANHFSAKQIECLIDISFRVAFILDPKNSPRRGFFGSIRDGWFEANLASKVGIIVGALTIGGVVAAAGSGVTAWLWRENNAPNPVEVAPPGPPEFLSVP